MKFNLKIFQNVLPKKSVLKSKKWVLLIMMLVVLFGLYWYSKKSHENYYNTEYVNTGDTPKRLTQPWTIGAGLETSRDKWGADTKLFRFFPHIIGIRDAYYKVEKLNGDQTIDKNKPEKNALYCYVTKFKSDREDGDYDTHIIFRGFNEDDTAADMIQKDIDPATIWKIKKPTDIVRPAGPSCDDLFQESFVQNQKLINNELQKIFTEGKDQEYITNIINEQVRVYVGNNDCESSEEFINKIWSDTVGTNTIGDNLRELISDKYPGIELITAKYTFDNISITEDIVVCEKNKGKGEDLSDTPNKEKCKLAGFYSDNVDTSLRFPLIQYSFLAKTNKNDGVYKLYTFNFDPTKKYRQNREDESKDISGNIATVYTSEKILDWLKYLRTTGGNTGM